MDHANDYFIQTGLLPMDYKYPIDKVINNEYG